MSNNCWLWTNVSSSSDKIQVFSKHQWIILRHFTNNLGQETTVITGEHPIYEILMNIKKKYPERYASIVVRLGGFYVAVNFMGTVGHLMKGSGTEELLVEAVPVTKEQQIKSSHWLTVERVWKEFGLLVRLYSETCTTTFLHFLIPWKKKMSSQLTKVAKI